MAALRVYRLLGAAVTATCLLATALAAQPPRPDPIEAAKAQQKLSDQKVTAEVESKIAEADRAIKAGNNAKAAVLLKGVLRDVDLAVGISGETRKTLTTNLTARIAIAEGRPVPAAPGGVALDPKTAEFKASQKAAVDRYIAQLKEVNAGIDRVAEAQAKGDNKAAETEIAKLAAAYPNNPAVLTLAQTGSVKSRVDDAVAFQKVQNARMAAVQKGIMESSLPAIRDVEFPANWKEITARRTTQVKLTAKEQKILEALDKPTSVNFNERPLEEALQDLSNALDQPLLIDKKSLEDLLVDLKKGVSLNAKGLSGRTVLRSILGSQGLTFIVKDETIQIVTLEKAKSTLTTRVYYLGDLVTGTGPFGDFRFGPLLNLAQTQENARVLIDTITKSVDPLVWKENSGPGSVVFDVPSMSLIVRAPTEVHFTLGKSFGGGR
jgi:hypothetical protein